MAKRKQHPIRVGVVGVGRGSGFARSAHLVGMELVALCDVWEEKLQPLAAELGVAAYTDYDKFLEHEMDAVILANYFHQHAPFAVKALEAGLHVMSETAACHTLAEGVALARAVEKTGKIYKFAENYPYSAYNQEMRRLFRKGLIGDFKYGEGEYIHPDDAVTRLRRSVGFDHWRNWMPATYYCTHSLAPVMFITDTRPVKVNGFVIPHDFNDPTAAMSCKRQDTASCIICRMDNDAVVKLLQVGLRGHQNYVRLHGNLGLMENQRTGDKEMLRIRREPCDKKRNEVVEKIYSPEFPVEAQQAQRSGHGGGDFFMNYHFAEAIRSGRPPYLDVYKGIEMSLVGILAYRSALNDSAPLEVPDFRKESVRKKHQNDDWSPDPTRRKKGQPWPSILGNIKPSEEAKAFARKVWKEQGYV